MAGRRDLRRMIKMLIPTPIIIPYSIPRSEEARNVMTQHAKSNFENFHSRIIAPKSIIKITAEIIMAAKLGFGMYMKYGVRNASDRTIRIPAINPET
jgi:hypothetical protein